MHDLLVLGCGYVGTALARSFHARGWRVTALTRNPAQAALLADLGLASVVEARLETEEWHARVPSSPRLVVNCVSAGGGGPDAYRSAYLETNRSILRWAAACARRPGHFIYTGSTGVYPQTDGSTVTEGDAGGPAVSPTARILLEAEQLIAAQGQVFRSATVLRLAGIYGPHRHYLLDQIREGITTLAGSGDFCLNLIHLDDILGAIEAVLRWREASAVEGFQVFNVSDGHPATKAEIVAWIAQRIGVPVPVFDPTIEPARRRASASSAWGIPHRVVSSRALVAATGWSPTVPSFRVGYERILAADHPPSSHTL